MGRDRILEVPSPRHGAMPALFGGIRAPSTLGSFLRSFTWGNVLQLQKVHQEFLAGLARRAPLLPGADVLAFLDVDSQYGASTIESRGGSDGPEGDRRAGRRSDRRPS
jgi:hypothetical protein